MSLSRRDFLKFGSATAAGVAVTGRGVDLAPVKALYRAPGSDTWEEKPLDWMYDQIAKRYYDAREKYFIEREKDKDGQAVTVNRLEAIASLGSACADNEECYLLSKLNRTFGIVYHEHQRSED